MSFYRSHLLEISSPELIRRYNETLEVLALRPTRLSSFHLDGRGWSPEVALEQNPDYLSYGPGQLLAIILRPEQRQLPLLNPITSFDQRVLKHYFATYTNEIADMTQRVALCLAFEPMPRQYTTVADVLGFESVTVKTNAGYLGMAAQEQERLINQFLEDEQAWADGTLRAKIIDSAKRYGDLRGRARLPSEVVFSDVSSFYTRLLGGIFVVTSGRKNRYVMLEDKAVVPPRVRHTYALQDPKLLPALLEDELLDVSEDYYRADIENLNRKYNALAADALFQIEPALNFASLSSTQRKQRLAMYTSKLPKVIFELEQFISKLQAGSKLRSRDLSRDLILFLLHPHTKLNAEAQDVMWRFLSRVQPSRLELVDIVQIYQRDIAKFFELYQGWSGQRQKWAEDYLQFSELL